jgi:signal transduction histidine kinase
LLAPALAGREVHVDLPKDATLIEFDAVLIERVLCNLLENAAKYSPEQSSIAITARLADGFAWISVLDRGRGFPAADTKSYSGCSSAVRRNRVRRARDWDWRSAGQLSTPMEERFAQRTAPMEAPR